jgi:hypothetical protein
MVTVAGGTGYLSGWLDWNMDGDFDDEGERAIRDEAVAAGPVQEVTFAVPDGVSVPATLNARFRLYAEEQREVAPTPSGLGEGGEVEDYTWYYSPTAVSLHDLHAAAQPLAGWPVLAGAALAFGVFLLKRKIR